MFFENKSLVNLCVLFHSLPNMELAFLHIQHNVLYVEKSAQILQPWHHLAMCSVTHVFTNTSINMAAVQLLIYQVHQNSLLGFM